MTNQETAAPQHTHALRIFLIRHGQTPGNVLGQLDTAHPGPGLTQLGERQAAALARSLANEEIGLLYASTLLRTQLTAAKKKGTPAAKYFRHMKSLADTLAAIGKPRHAQ